MSASLIAVAMVELIDRPGHPIALVRRGSSEHWAFPWGAVEPDEEVEAAAMRCGGEALGLQMWLKDMLGAYCEPTRALRAQALSIAFVAIAVGELQAADPDVTVGVFAPDELPVLAGGQADLVADFLRYRATGRMPVQSAGSGAPARGFTGLLRGRTR